MTYGPHPQSGPHHETEKEIAGLFRAGKVAVWVWIVLALTPVAIFVACCGLCGFGGVAASVFGVTPTPSP